MFPQELTTIATRPDFSQAACAGVDPDLFFPGRGESVKEAKAVCEGCACRAECLQYALDNHENVGVWGMTSERERRTIRRRQVQAV